MELSGDQVTAKQRVLTAVKQKDIKEAEKPRGSWQSQSQEPEEGEVLMTEQPEKVFFDPSNPEQFFLIGSKLSALDREQLLQVPISN